MHAQYLEVVKMLIQSSPKFSDCRVSIYTEPSISSTIFFIYADGYKHIFKAPFGLLESNLTATALADVIIDEVKEWRDKSIELLTVLDSNAYLNIVSEKRSTTV